MNQGMKDRRQANMGHTGSGHSHHAMMIADFKRRFWISLVITIPILILSPVIQQFLGVGTSLRFTGDMYLLFIFSSIVYFYGGYPFLKGLIDEIKIKQPGMMTLVAVAITTAYLYSSAVVMGLMGEVFFWELATLIDIMLLGHWLEMKSIMGASRALEELARLMPSDAHKVMPDGSTRDVPLSELKLADKVLVKPGEKIPADGSVIEGITSVNESMLTGESNPVSKGTGAQVIGGAVNGEGSVTIEIRKTGKDSFLSQVIKLVNEAQQSKSKTQDLANRAAMWLTIIALGGGLITLLVWTILIKMNFGFSLERTVTVMVIACPHALGLAVPLVVAASTAIAARNGLLIRNRIAFEKARNIEAIIFDKTGTLTQGKFGVTDTVVIDKRYTAQDILQYAASVESHSEHPIAKGIVTAIKDIPTVEGFKSIPGKGAQGRVQGKTVLVVSPGYLRENNLKVDAPQIEKLTQQGKTVVFVIMEEKVAGAIALADIIRPESKQAVTELKRMGIRCLMLTGDNRQVAKWVAEEIGLDEYFAEVLPQDKASKVKEIQQRGLTVAMTGDGVNDAPALAQADVGIAIGAGTDVAAETADIILVRSNPLDAVAILGLARMTYSKMVQNLLWATGYNVFAIPLAAGVLYRYGILLTPAMGAVLMSVSTIIVAINATLFKMPGSQV
ncbi:MAG: copper-translocating P-type ATPase [Candidatus Margulisbacteria bacterium GWD2_39_127]|nr:MAG: copper-translocating P-type ATPase [Candidatus Margulisbacteria bacterium GWD2_39_127]